MNISSTITRGFGKAGAIVAKHSPELLTAAGVTCIIGGTILACRSTLRVQDILDAYKANDQLIKDVKDGKLPIKDGETYSENDYKKDIISNKLQTAGKLVKEYLPAVTLMGLGIACILGAHNIMSKRNVALVGALKTTQEAFDKYRGRVIEAVGKDKEHEIYVGKAEKTETIEVEGKPVKMKTVSDKPLGAYVAYFDENNPNWSNSMEQNLIFLKMVQCHLNDRLEARGHVFLNEVRDELGLPRIPEGQVVGWAYKKDDGDHFIDFGIFGDDSIINLVANAEGKSILLDFNVDGVVWDLI